MGVAVCEEEFQPKEGLMFDNLEQYENFYKIYARHVDLLFVSKRNKDGVEKCKYYVSLKEGLMENSKNAKPKPKKRLRKGSCQRRGVMLWLHLREPKKENMCCLDSMKVIHICLSPIKTITN